MKLREKNFPSQKPKNPFTLPQNIKKQHKRKLKRIGKSKNQKTKLKTSESVPDGSRPGGPALVRDRGRADSPVRHRRDTHGHGRCISG